MTSFDRVQPTRVVKYSRYSLRYFSRRTSRFEHQLPMCLNAKACPADDQFFLTIYVLDIRRSKTGGLLCLVLVVFDLIYLTGAHGYTTPFKRRWRGMPENAMVVMSESLGKV
jgi:hypothetical protein